MLRQSSHLVELPVASLHTGRHIDRVKATIINPHDLSIAGFYLESHAEEILLTSDIREVTTEQIIIDSADVIAAPEDLIRLQPILALRFELLDSKVKTKSGQRLGSVEEYVYDDISWKAQKLHVRQPIWRNLNGGLLIIDRRQIIEVDDTTVVVEDALLRAGKLAPQQAP